MKKLFILPVLAFLLVATIVSAATLTRNAPTQVTPGQVFTVTYTPSGTPTGNWFVAWEDTATGGCQPAKYQAFLANGGTGSTTFTAPQSGSCTLTGFYQFTNENQQNLQSITINIGGACVPNPACASDTCTGQTCSDGCGGVVQGTKSCSVVCPTDAKQCSDGSYVSRIPPTCDFALCPGTTCTPSSTCASTTCSDKTCSDGCGGTVQGTKSCVTTPASYCDFTSKFALFEIIKGDDCTNGLIILIVGLILAIVLIK